MQRLRRLAALAAFLLVAAPALPATLTARLPAAQVRVDGLRRYGPECENIVNTVCDQDCQVPAPGCRCRHVEFRRCTPGGMLVAFTVTVVAHPGRLRVELWDVHPSCAEPGGSCTKGLRSWQYWDVPPDQVGAGASKDFELQAHADLPADTLEVVVASAVVAADRAAPPPPCEDVGPTPTGAAIAARVAALEEDAPGDLASWLDFAAAQPGADLESAFRRALVAARCRSGGQPGPANPYDVPAAEVQRWIVGLVDDDAPLELQALRAFVTRLPAGTLRWAWLRAVELRRGLPVRLTP